MTNIAPKLLKEVPEMLNKTKSFSKIVGNGISKLVKAEPQTTKMGMDYCKNLKSGTEAWANYAKAKCAIDKNLINGNDVNKLVKAEPRKTKIGMDYCKNLKSGTIAWPNDTKAKCAIDKNFINNK